MRAFALVLLVLSSASAHAQPPAPEVDTNAPPLNDRRVIRKVRACLERLARVPSEPVTGAAHVANAAARDCEAVGRRAPGPAANALVAYQQAMHAWAVQRAANASEHDARVNALNRRIAFLPLDINTNWTSAEDDARIEAAVTRLEQEATNLSEELGSLDRSRFDALASLRLRLQDDAQPAEAQIERLRTLLAGSAVPSAIFNQARVAHARLHAGTLLLPGDVAIRRGAERYAAFLRELGGRDGAARAQSRARAARAAGRRFPTASTRDADVEEQARTAFADQGWNETVLAVRLLDDWSLDREGGRVVSRRRRAAIGVQLPSGLCRVYDFTILQPRTSGGWGAVRRNSHSSADIGCDAIPASVPSPGEGE